MRCNPFGCGSRKWRSRPCAIMPSPAPACFLRLSNASATPVWPPTGLAIALMLVRGPTMLTAIFLGAFAANFATTPHVLTFGAIALGNSLEALVAFVLLQRWADGVLGHRLPAWRRQIRPHRDRRGCAHQRHDWRFCAGRDRVRRQFPSASRLGDLVARRCRRRHSHSAGACALGAHLARSRHPRTGAAHARHLGRRRTGGRWLSARFRQSRPACATRSLSWPSCRSCGLRFAWGCATPRQPRWSSRASQSGACKPDRALSIRPISTISLLLLVAFIVAVTAPSLALAADRRVAEVRLTQTRQELVQSQKLEALGTAHRRRCA